MAAFTAACIDNERLVAQIGPNPSTERGHGLHINAHPREPKMVYASGRYVVVRDLETPSDCFVYRGHNSRTTVAKFAPNGFWVASADISGKIRVWAWDNPEHPCKLETQVFGGPVYDLDWDGESKRIVAVGEGGDMLAKCIMWDSGNSVGEMVGHNKRVISCAYRQTRPFRIFTAGEDFRTCFYAGPPFQLDHSNTEHTNWANCVRFSPDDSKAISVGSDKKIALYDGRTGEPTGEIANDHAGTIYSAAWSPDSTRVLTASADKTVKLWNVESGECETTFTISDDPQVGDMQVAVLWKGDFMISVSLNGNINYLDAASPDAPVRIVQAHQVAITSICADVPNRRFFTGSFDGVLCSWGGDMPAFDSTRLVGPDKRSVCAAVHGGRVQGVAFNAAAGTLMSVGFDDQLRTANLETSTSVSAAGTSGQPSSIAVSSATDLVAVATNQMIMFFRGDRHVSSIEGLAYEATSVDLLDEEELAVGGNDNKVHIFTLTVSNDVPSGTESATIEGHRGVITAVKYSPDRQLLAVGDANREINVWERGSWGARVKSLWTFHTTRITALCWSPSGARLASGSSDEAIYIWNIEDPRSREHIPFAHKEGVTGLAFLEDEHLVSVGNDSCACIWNVA